MLLTKKNRRYISVESSLSAHAAFAYLNEDFNG